MCHECGYSCYPHGMAQLICKLIGHREFTDEVLTVRPWEDPDFSGYVLEDFREDHCLRCGGSLLAQAA